MVVATAAFSSCMIPFSSEKSQNLDDWKYSCIICIDNTNNPQMLTDYQVAVVLDSGNFNFSHAQSDGSDLRFTNQNRGLLPYWIESYDLQSKKARIWVKVNSIPASGTATISMYYGNPAAVSASDGGATFEVFDDFRTNTTEDYTWEHVDSGPPPGPISTYSWDPVNKWVHITTGDNSGMKARRSVALPLHGHFFISFRKLRDYPKDNVQRFYIKEDEYNYYAFIVSGSGYDPILHPDRLRKYVGGILVDGSGVGGGVFVDSNTDHTLEGLYTNTMMQIDIDGEPADTLTTTNTVQITPVSFSFLSDQIDLYWYEIRIRKYTDPEPTVHVGPANYCDVRWILVVVIAGFICVLLWTLHNHKKKSSSENKIQGFEDELRRIKRRP